MQLANVLGTATATEKHDSMQGQRLLVVQGLMADGATPDGEPVLAVDRLGAGRGALVVITNDGKHTKEQLGDEHTPVRYSVIGIVD